MMNKSELRIIGAISIDLNGMSDEYQANEKDKRNKAKIFLATLKEFCSNATMHGIRYFTERKRHWIERLNHFDTILQICSKELTDTMDGIIVSNTQSIYDVLKKISPEIASILPFATFTGRIIHVKPIFTDAGLCYTFNALNSWDVYKDEIAPELMTVVSNPNASYWNIIDEIDLNPNYSYPYRVYGSGLRNGVFMLLTMTLDKLHHFCNDFAQGFRLSLHLPHETPRSANEFIHIPVEQEIYVSVKPNVIMTSKGLRGYAPNRRGCYFKSERQLRFFKSYAQQNSVFECLANFTKETCGCVRFSMPRDRNTKICTVVDSRCNVSAGDRFSTDLIVKQCNCLPDCTSITYDVEISQAPFRYTEDDIELRKSLNQSSDEVGTSLFVSFKQPYFIALNRTETYTMADFMASCGGLLGLFMGISLLSIVELIYYFTLRLCCTMRQTNSIDTDDSTWAKRNHLPVVVDRK